MFIILQWAAIECWRDYRFSTKNRGWGLGLSLAQRIIKDIHGGMIAVENSSNKGTKIKIDLEVSWNIFSLLLALEEKKCYQCLTLK